MSTKKLNAAPQGANARNGNVNVQPDTDASHNRNWRDMRTLVFAGAPCEPGRPAHAILTRYDLTVIARDYVEMMLAQQLREGAGPTRSARALKLAANRLASISSEDVAVRTGKAIAHVVDRWNTLGPQTEISLPNAGTIGPSISTPSGLEALLNVDAYHEVLEEALRSIDGDLHHGKSFESGGLRAVPASTASEQPISSQHITEGNDSMPEVGLSTTPLIAPSLGLILESALRVEGFTPTMHELGVLARHYFHEACNVEFRRWVRECTVGDWLFLSLADDRLMEISETLGVDKYREAIGSVAAAWRASYAEANRESMTCDKCRLIYASARSQECPVCENREQLVEWLWRYWSFQA